MTGFAGFELPADLAAQSSEEQRRIIDAGLLMGQMAFRHAAAVILSPPPYQDGDLYNGTAFVLRIDGRHYLGTAWHVVKHWLDRTSAGEEVLFQVGDACLNPGGSLAWQDMANDIAFLHLTDAELTNIPISIYEPVGGWPPQHPVPKSYIFVSGFPSVIRDRPTDEQLEFHALSAMVQVTSVGERHLVCKFEREHWVKYNNGRFPPGTELGGISGAPVFAVQDLAYPLLGLAGEFNSSFDLLYVRTLSHLPTFFSPRKHI